MIENTANLLGYSSPFVILLSAGIFSLFDLMPKDAFRESPLFKLIVSVDSCSFGIYLVHMLIVRYILRYCNIDLLSYGDLTLLAYILMLLVTFAASYIIVRGYKLLTLMKQHIKQKLI